MGPLNTVILGFLAIFFVPTVGLLACREILRDYEFVETNAEANKYALLTGGISVLSAFPSAAAINMLPSRARLRYIGEATTPYQNAYYYSDFSADAQAAIETAIASDGGAVSLPAAVKLPANFVMINQHTSHEFTVLTDVVLLGQPVSEMTALLLFMTAFTMFWGLLVLSYLIFGTDTDDGEETEETDGDEDGNDGASTTDDVDTYEGVDESTPDADEPEDNE